MRFSTTIVAASLLSGFVSARQAWHVPAAFKQPVYEETAVDDDASTAGFRYLNANTAQYRVKSLPGIPFNVGEMYAGQFPVKAGDPTRALFAIFQPSVGKPVNELTVWFNGGPGCSSLTGFLEENGRFVYNGKTQPVLNKYSWVNETNMLWVEYPVGVGFSTGVVTATNEQDAAADFVGFIKNFQQTFGMKNYKMYITGESYAGRYVPYVSAAVLDQKDQTYYNLKGALTYDPCIGQWQHTQENAFAYPFLQKFPQFFNFNQSFTNSVAEADQKCGYAAFRNKYYVFPSAGQQPQQPNPSPKVSGQNCDVWDTIYEQASQNNKCFDVYEANQTCPSPYDPLSPGGAQQPYFNQMAVKKAIHAPLAIQWSQCSNTPVFIGVRGNGGPEMEGDLSADPIQHVLPQVIEATNRVLVANGNYDYIIITGGTLTAIQNMTWNGVRGFNTKPATPITIPGQGRTGTQHYERGLMWAETYKCGHFEPEFQPATSLAHLSWLLGRTNTIG